MDYWSGRHPTSSETRLLSAPATDRERIEHGLAHAELHVARMQPSPATQHLKRVLESCRRAVDGWRASPPTEAEAHALRDRVEQALQLAKTTSPTVRFRRQA
jgi:hypothetical protein